MKINETKRDHINEGPLDILTKSGRAQMRAARSGKNTVQKTANNLINQFSEYLGVLGKRRNQAETQDVINFLKSKKVDVSDIDANDYMDFDQMKTVLQSKARDAVLAKRGLSTGAAPAGQTAPTPPAGKSSPGAAPSSPPAAPPAGGGKGKNKIKGLSPKTAASLNNAMKQMSDDQKKQLVAMLAARYGTT